MELICTEGGGLPQCESTRGKYYTLYLKNGSIIKVTANSYYTSSSNTIIFTLLNVEELHKILNRGNTPDFVFEIHLAHLKFIAQDDYIKIQEAPPVIDILELQKLATPKATKKKGTTRDTSRNRKKTK